VISADRDKLLVMMEGDGNPPRRQTYTLNGKHAYVRPGERFEGEITILAGVPQALADLNQHLADVYNPLDQIGSASPLDRYAAVKALRFRPDLHRQGAGSLERMLDTEREGRVALEAAASAAALHSAKGQERLAAALWGNGPSELSMEAILILTELKTPFARAELVRAAAGFLGDERRQAAIWGLGKSGLKSYGDLISFIGDGEENVAYHAIAAFGPDTPRPVIEQLIALLIEGEPRLATAASEALRVIGSRDALECLVRAANEHRGNIDWLLATLGRLPPDLVRERLKGSALLERIEPMLLVAHGASWLAIEDAVTDMAFLVKQNL